MVVPIGDVNPTSRRSFVMGSFALLNIATFVLLQLPLEGCDQLVFVYRWSVIPAELLTLSPLDPGALTELLGECAAEVQTKNVPLSLVTSLFLHGGLAHLVGNMIFLIVFGDNVEDRLGHGRFTLFYLVGGFAATLSYALLNPNSIVPLVGASGSIAAVLGAYLLCYPRARVMTLVPFPLYLVALVLPGVRIRRFLLIVAVVGMPAWLLLGGWFVLQAYAAGTPVDQQVAYEAHIGGFLAGIVLLLLLDMGRQRRGRPTFHPPRQHGDRRR